MIRPDHGTSSAVFIALAAVGRLQFKMILLSTVALTCAGLCASPARAQVAAPPEPRLESLEKVADARDVGLPPGTSPQYPPQLQATVIRPDGSSSVVRYSSGEWEASRGPADRVMDRLRMFRENPPPSGLAPADEVSRLRNLAGRVGPRVRRGFYALAGRVGMTRPIPATPVTALLEGNFVVWEHNGTYIKEMLGIRKAGGVQGAVWTSYQLYPTTAGQTLLTVVGPPGTPLTTLQAPSTGYSIVPNAGDWHSTTYRTVAGSPSWSPCPMASYDTGLPSLGPTPWQFVVLTCEQAVARPWVPSDPLPYQGTPPVTTPGEGPEHGSTIDNRWGNGRQSAEVERQRVDTALAPGNSLSDDEKDAISRSLDESNIKPLDGAQDPWEVTTPPSIPFPDRGTKWLDHSEKLPYEDSEEYHRDASRTVERGRDPNDLEVLRCIREGDGAEFVFDEETGLLVIVKKNADGEPYIDTAYPAEREYFDRQCR